MSRPVPPERQARVCECGALGFVPLTKGFTALINANRVAEVGQYLWSAHTVGKSRKVYGSASVHGSKTLLHRYLTDAAPQLDVDHRDGVTLNNTDDNLRTCLRAENLRNARRSHGAVPFKGVTRLANGRFLARIWLAGRSSNLGCHGTPEDAALAYDRAAIEQFGEFAATNASLGLLPSEAA